MYFVHFVVRNGNFSHGKFVCLLAASAGGNPLDCMVSNKQSTVSHVTVCKPRQKSRLSFTFVFCIVYTLLSQMGFLPMGNPCACCGFCRHHPVNCMVIATVHGVTRYCMLGGKRGVLSFSFVFCILYTLCCPNGNFSVPFEIRVRFSPRKASRNRVAVPNT